MYFWGESTRSASKKLLIQFSDLLSPPNEKLCGM